MTIYERFALLRHALQLSVDDLAELTELSADDLDAFGSADPGSDEAAETVRAIAGQLGLNPSYLLRENEPTQVRPVSSTMERFSAEERSIVEAQARIWLEDRFDIDALYDQIETRPYLDLPNGFPKAADSLVEADGIAYDLRQALGIGGMEPIRSLSNLSDGMRIPVGLVQGFDGFDAGAYMSEDDLLIPFIVTSAVIDGELQRFALARELAYFLIENATPEQAEVFSRALLIPDAALIHALGEKRGSLEMLELHFLKKQYGISIRQLLTRAAELGIITGAYHKSLLKELESQDDWSDGDEPGIAYPLDVPEVPIYQMLRLVGEGLLEPDQAADMLGLADWEDVALTLFDV